MILHCSNTVTVSEIFFNKTPNLRDVKLSKDETINNPKGTFKFRTEQD